MSTASAFDQEYKSLIEAYRNGLLIDVEKIVSRWATNATIQDFPRHKSCTREKSALHWAAEHGQLDVANILLEHGFEVRAIDEVGHTALHVACDFGHVELVNALITQHGAQVDAKSSEGDTALHRACWKGHVEVVNALITKHGAQVENKNNVGHTALHVACDFGHVELVNALITQHGAQVDAKSSGGFTPLHLACWKGHVEVVNVLITKHGARIRTLYWYFAATERLLKNAEDCQSVCKDLIVRNPTIASQPMVSSFWMKVLSREANIVTLLQFCESAFVSKKANAASMHVHICGDPCAGKSLLRKTLMTAVEGSWLTRTVDASVNIPPGPDRHTRGIETDTVYVASTGDATHPSLQVVVHDYAGQREFKVNHWDSMAMPGSAYVVVLPLYKKSDDEVKEPSRLYTDDEIYAMGLEWLRCIYTVIHRVDDNLEGESVDRSEVSGSTTAAATAEDESQSQRQVRNGVPIVLVVNLFTEYTKKKREEVESKVREWRDRYVAFFGKKRSSLVFVEPLVINICKPSQAALLVSSFVRVPPLLEAVQMIQSQRFSVPVVVDDLLRSFPWGACQPKILLRSDLVSRLVAHMETLPSYGQMWRDVGDYIDTYKFVREHVLSVLMTANRVLSVSSILPKSPESDDGYVTVDPNWLFSKIVGEILDRAKATIEKQTQLNASMTEQQLEELISRRGAISGLPNDLPLSQLLVSLHLAVPLPRDDANSPTQYCLLGLIEQSMPRTVADDVASVKYHNRPVFTKEEDFDRSVCRVFSFSDDRQCLLPGFFPLFFAFITQQLQRADECLDCRYWKDGMILEADVAVQIRETNVVRIKKQIVVSRLLTNDGIPSNEFEVIVRAQVLAPHRPDHPELLEDLSKFDVAWRDMICIRHYLRHNVYNLRLTEHCCNPRQRGQQTMPCSEAELTWLQGRLEERALKLDRFVGFASTAAFLQWEVQDRLPIFLSLADPDVSEQSQSMFSSLSGEEDVVEKICDELRVHRASGAAIDKIIDDGEMAQTALRLIVQWWRSKVTNAHTESASVRKYSAEWVSSLCISFRDVQRILRSVQRAMGLEVVEEEAERVDDKVDRLTHIVHDIREHQAQLEAQLARQHQEGLDMMRSLFDELNVKCQSQQTSLERTQEETTALREEVADLRRRAEEGDVEQGQVETMVLRLQRQVEAVEDQQREWEEPLKRLQDQVREQSQTLRQEVARGSIQQAQMQQTMLQMERELVTMEARQRDWTTVQDDVRVMQVQIIEVKNQLALPR